MTQINFGLIVGRCFFDKRYQVITPIILGLYWEENLVLIGGLYWTLSVHTYGHRKMHNFIRIPMILANI